MLCSTCRWLHVGLSRYVFVDIGIDVDHLVESLKANFDSKFKMVLAGTIQFATGMQVD